jgi:hypothetical protein
MERAVIRCQLFPEKRTHCDLLFKLICSELSSHVSESGDQLLQPPATSLTVSWLLILNDHMDVYGVQCLTISCCLTLQ